MKIVAILDGDGLYTGHEQVANEDAVDRVVLDQVPDLPTDGTYRWDGAHGRFVPLGHRFIATPAAPSVSERQAVFLTLRALVREQPIPEEVARYVDWYEEFELARAERTMAVVKRGQNT